MISERTKGLSINITIDGFCDKLVMIDNGQLILPPELPPTTTPDFSVSFRWDENVNATPKPIMALEGILPDEPPSEPITIADDTSELQ